MQLACLTPFATVLLARGHVYCARYALHLTHFIGPFYDSRYCSAGGVLALVHQLMGLASQIASVVVICLSRELGKPVFKACCVCCNMVSDKGPLFSLVQSCVLLTDTFSFLAATSYVDIVINQETLLEGKCNTSCEKIGDLYDVHGCAKISSCAFHSAGYFKGGSNIGTNKCNYCLCQCEPVGGVVQEVDVSDKMFTTHEFDLYSTCKGKCNPKLPEKTGLVRTDYEGYAVSPSLFLSIARYVYMHAGVQVSAASARV